MQYDVIYAKTKLEFKCNQIIGKTVLNNQKNKHLE